MSTWQSGSGFDPHPNDYIHEKHNGVILYFVWNLLALSLEFLADALLPREMVCEVAHLISEFETAMTVWIRSR